MKLYQLLALLNKIKANVKRKQTDVFRCLQNPQNFQGFKRSYTPVGENNYHYPTEQKQVNHNLNNCIEEYSTATVKLIDYCFTQDLANTEAKANLECDGLLIANLPVTSLLFLESQLTNIKTFVTKLPTLTEDLDWQYDHNLDKYVSNTIHKTAKKIVRKPLVLAAATSKYPAQVDLIEEEVIEGTWSTVNFSSAIPVQQKQNYLTKIERLTEAVLLARETANTKEIQVVNTGEQILNWIFQGEK